MTPEEKKRKKRMQIWRIVIPVLLAGMFASLALMDKNGVFSAANQAPLAATAAPEPVPVPYTRLAVMNRLENDGFTETDGMLLRNDTYAGTLEFREKGEVLTGASYSLIILPATAASSSGSAYDSTFQAQTETDRKTASLVFRALFEAVLGGKSPNEAHLKRGEKILDNCFTSDRERTETLETEDCTVTFNKAYTDGVYVLTITAVRK